MLLPAASAAQLSKPVPAAVEGEKPKITIENNAVKDDFGELTGYLEVAIRVQTPVVAASEESGTEGSAGETAGEQQTFSYIGVALEYNSSILTPVSWTDANGETTNVAIAGTTPDTYDKQTKFPVLKPEKNVSAQARVSGPTKNVDTPDAGEEGTTATPNGLFYIMAEATQPEALKADTVLAVVRFQYDPAAYDIKADAGNVTQWLPGGANWLVKFAPDAVAADSFVSQMLLYKSDRSEFYYTDVTDPQASAGYIVASDAADETTKYTTNLLTVEGENPDIRFEVTNKTSYDSGDGLHIEDLATILFYDWDDSLIGVLTVPKKGDVRARVNEYIEDTLIHPDLRLPDNESYDAAKVSSLARTNTYRGKYPHETPQGPTVTNTEEYQKESAKYPLTNKLDYVFFKRPMTASETTGVDFTQPTAESSTDAQWDTEYPYVHGWAVVPQGHPEKIWTTLGVGELSGYTADRTNSAAAATLKVSDGMAFELADFENFDLTKGGTDTTTNVYSVKAVYEPGTELLTSGYYRIVKDPSYNKLNTLAASQGGAYSVTMTFERANVPVNGDGLLRGVYRMRSPVFRQDTTTDLRWEENEALGVDHNLPNPSNEEASSDKNKTTYTKVDVTNTETLDISMALSARQNKVDYLLIDSYGSNFVSGGQRSDGNFARTGTAFTVDNYNYYVNGESNETDNYYDVPNFDNKEGSRGFVLYGTMNNIMEQATKWANDAAYESTFQRYVTYFTMADANLRDANELEPEVLNQAAMRTAIKGAAEAAKAHKNDPAYDCWDNDLDCAKLTYHQLQLFITGGTLLTVSAADAEKISWCRLHADCAELSSGKPKTWDELIAAARDAAKYKDIELLTSGEITSWFHLAADTDGGAFDNGTNFRIKLVAAVNAIDGIRGNNTAAISWDELQGVMLATSVTTQTDIDNAADTSVQHYWWYNGGTKPTDFAGTVSAAILAGTGRPAALNTLEAAFDRMKAAPDDDVAMMDWVTLTENLATANGVPFNDFAAFKTAIQNAAAALGTDASWGDVQFYVIHGSAPTAGDAAEIAGYWWHNGGKKITNTKTLLEAAKNNSDTWKNLRLSDLDDNAGLHFRQSFDGEKYTDIDTFKTAVTGYLAATGSRADDWQDLQYYLIHGVRSESNYLLGLEAAYYWWQNGGSAQPVDFSLLAEGETSLDSVAPETRADRLAAALMDAAFRAKFNGNKVAWQQLTAGVLTSGRLIKTEGGATGFDALTKFEDGDIESVKTAVLGMVGAAPAFPAPTATWENIQKAVLTDGSAEATEYWWKKADAKPSEANDPWVDFATLVTLVEQVATDVKDGNDYTASEAALRGFLTEAVAQNMGLYGADGVNPVGQSELDSIDWTGSLNTGSPLDYGEFGANCWGSGTFHFTWYQMQDVILNGGTWLDTEVDSVTMVTDPTYMGFSITPPDWVLNPPATTALSLRSAKTPQQATTVSQPQVSVDPDTGIETETRTESTDMVHTDPETGAMVIETMDVTTTTERWETETGLVCKTTVTTVVRTLTINAETGQVESRTVENLEPEITVVVTPKEGEDPEPSEEPAPEESPKLESTDNPEETPKPESTDNPEETPKPEPTDDPEGTPKPEPTDNPEGTPKPEPTVTPEETPAPEITPEVTPTPAPTETPGGTPAPGPATTPEVTPTPELTFTPEPEATPTPELTPAPEPTATPEATPAPEPTATPEPSAPVDSGGSAETEAAPAGHPAAETAKPDGETLLSSRTAAASRTSAGADGALARRAPQRDGPILWGASPGIVSQSKLLPPSGRSERRNAA